MSSNDADEIPDDWGLDGGVHDDDDWWQDYADREEDHERRIEEAEQKIVTCFEEVRRELDHWTACDLFSIFARLLKPARKRKGKHDPDFDKALLAAYSAAPYRQQMAAVYAVAAAHGKLNHVSKESIVRHLRRLIREQKQFQKDWAAVLAQFTAKRGHPDASFTEPTS
jgi:hypothetical protein